ncbi:hypothetical protein STENM223S_09206 [Streptomyces tendae]
MPAYELVRLQLNEVAPTPLNPRRNFGTEEELTRFGEELRQAQLAACVAVTRNAYLALWPEHEEQIGSAKHVLINGERPARRSTSGWKHWILLSGMTWLPPVSSSSTICSRRTSTAKTSMSSSGPEVCSIWWTSARRAESVVLVLVLLSSWVRTGPG